MKFFYTATLHISDSKSVLCGKPDEDMGYGHVVTSGYICRCPECLSIWKFMKQL